MIKELYEKWLEKANADIDIKKELEAIRGNDGEIEDRFYKELAFGTGGLRGVIGAGTNRMNYYTVGKATQGLSDYINEEHSGEKSVAIAYDSRIKSDYFAKSAAEVFAANGIKVYIYPTLSPTPSLSFAVRYLKCKAGIVLTASHNPAKYNGYKAYGEDGCQITIEAADKVLSFINKIDCFEGVKRISFEQGIESGSIEYISQGVNGAFLDSALECRLCDKSLVENSGLKIVYTPLNGSGLHFVTEMMKEIGIKDFSVVEEQREPNGNFPTCPYPNPEIKEALELALKQLKEENADLVLATDPDCDRVGTAVMKNGEPVLINGNQMGVLLLDYICSLRTKNGTMPKNPVAIKTIVTTEMARSVAEKYGVEIRDVLTGFKFIGEQIGFLEEKGEESRYIFGFEESYGYLSSTKVRDKDAVNASLLICEMTAYYKSQGKSLLDVLDELYAEHGYYLEKLESYVFEGSTGMEKMNDIMNKIRNAGIKEIADVGVKNFCDYLASKKYFKGGEEEIKLPKSDVLQFVLDGGTSVVVRPSGTEPKLKIYYSVKCENEEKSAKLYGEISGFMQRLLK